MAIDNHSLVTGLAEFRAVSTLNSINHFQKKKKKKMCAVPLSFSELQAKSYKTIDGTLTLRTGQGPISMELH